MYADRIKVLTKAYRGLAKSNKAYDDSSKRKLRYQKQLDFLTGMNAQVKALDSFISEEEGLWRKSVLSALEAEIIEDLAWVFPFDGYRVALDTKVSRNKIHIEATVNSVASKTLPGGMDSTQGRLFQQVVSFAALIGVMSLLGIKTVYIDEAFSGSSKKNIGKLNGLLKHIGERGFNIIMIAQDTAMANGIAANYLYLQRSVDNKTTIRQEVTQT